MVARVLAAPRPPSAARHHALQREFGRSIVLESTAQLSGIGQIRQSAISAASEGNLEGCRSYLSRPDVTNHERASIYCRLSEALYNKGSRDDALECAHRAFNLLPEREEIAHMCAWVFSNCGSHERAAAAYERLLSIRPHWPAGHRHASGSYAVTGRLDLAISHGKKASDLDPQSFEFAFHAGCLLETVGQPARAVDYLMRALALDPSDTGVLRHLSATLLAQDQTEKTLCASYYPPSGREFSHNSQK